MNANEIVATALINRLKGNLLKISSRLTIRIRKKG